MTQEEMNHLVPEKLRQMEEEYGMQVLLAVESGSRAWGFASPDSDFDVRFLYKRPKDRYLALNAARDVIELPVDDTWDVCGWDLDKTLRLLYKSNPTLFEWMRSPIRYCDASFTERLAPLADMYFSVKNSLYHYLNTARHTRKAHLLGEIVRPKKYFYALRPLLACEWVLQEHTAPPVAFAELTAACLPEALRTPLDELLDIKRNSPEKSGIKPIPAFDRYLNDRIAHFDALLPTLPKEPHMGWEPLNTFFLEEVGRKTG